MKINIFSKNTLAVLLLSALGGGVAAFAVTDNPGAHPPLKFQVDNKALDRNASEPVSYASEVKKASPSVVYISSSKTLRQPARAIDPNNPIIQRYFGGNLPRNLMPRNLTEQSLGSGIIVSSDGYILTNNHVVDGADEVTVSFGEPQKDYTATIVGRDAKVDVALLKIDATGLPAVTLGNSDQLQVGDVVFAMGDPFGIGMTVTHGIVSALGRGGMGIEAYEDFIQTDAPINPGNSGGALVDAEGRVVGLNTAILSDSGESNGVGFAIPINLVRTIAEQLVSTGLVERGFLGVSPEDLSPDLAAQFGATSGALLADVSPGTPAVNAGLQHGDVITKINGEEISDARHLSLAVGNLAPGAEVTVEYLRNGKTSTVKVRLAAQPVARVAGNGRRGGGQSNGGQNISPGTAKDEGVLNGVTVADITQQIRAEFQLPTTVTGAVITDVDPNSASARSGLQEGDVITELDRQPVADADQAVKLSDQIKGPKVVVLVWRSGTSRYLVEDETK
jgi:serine protease Do